MKLFSLVTTFFLICSCANTHSDTRSRPRTVNANKSVIQSPISNSVDTSSVLMQINELQKGIESKNWITLSKFFLLPLKVDSSDEIWYCFSGQNDKYLRDTTAIVAQNFPTVCDSLLFRMEIVTLLGKMHLLQLDTIIDSDSMVLDSTEACEVSIKYVHPDQTVELCVMWYQWPQVEETDTWAYGYTIVFQVVEGKRLQYLKTKNLG